MPIRISVPLGAPAWIDLFTSDIAAAQSFYGDLFGWTFDGGQPEHGGYVGASKNGHAIAGLAPCPDDQQSQWTVYLAVSDARAVAGRVVSGGGSVVVEPTGVGGEGTFAVFRDASGAQVGAWQADGLMGYELESEPGAPAWSELHTHEFTSARSFYERVFGWQVSVMSDTDEFRYLRHEVDGVPLAGLMDASSFQPDPAPGQWSIYFQVADVDSSCEVASGGGGTVEDTAKDTPFGRLATIRDPRGARFKLLTP